MTGIPRTRTRDVGNYISGSRRGFGITSLSSQSEGTQVCSDVVGNPMGQNPLTLTKTTNRPIILNGSNGLGGNSNVTFTDYPADFFKVIRNHLGQLYPFKDATQAIANANPGEPPVSLPNFLYELKDVPGMLRHAANRARMLHEYWLANGWIVSHRRLAKYYSVRHAGEDWLNYIFGWRPFFSDLSDILDLSSYLEKRRKKFYNVKNGELRASGSLGANSNQSHTKETFQSLLQIVSGTCNTTTTFEKWWSARYRVDPIRYGASLSGDRRAELSDMLGFDNSLPIMIWEAMPWSWFSDWFFNVGSIIKVLGNRQGCQLRDAVVMSRTLTVAECTVTGKPSWMAVTDGAQGRSTKTRALFSPSFVRSDGGFNIFQPSHLATLASLKVTRGSGSSSF
jgi:hypothetical protein